MTTPVFGFLAVTSGSFEGAVIRDMRLANELHRRGFRVVVYWMVQQNPALVAPGIRQRVLARAMRYATRRPTRVGEIAGRLFDLLPHERRIAFLQTQPGVARRLARNLINVVCDGEGGDPRLVARLARFVERDGVSHLLPTFALACPFALAAKRASAQPFDYLVTFQGEELFVGYAHELGRKHDYFTRLREVVQASPWKAIAVSADYARRLHDEMHVDAEALVAIPPGVDVTRRRGRRPAFDELRRTFPRLRPDLPIVSFVGRNDSEKGIDLLLYAARMVQADGRRFQLVVAGGSTFGSAYREACEQVADHLRLDVHWQGRISEPVRDALYAHSRCVVYPPVHREPFGMVAVEALSHGTPVIVPDHGGLVEAICSNGHRAGLTFRVWDSRDLARQIDRMLADDAVHRELARNALRVAEPSSVERLADRVLALLEIPAAQSTRDDSGSHARAMAGCLPDRCERDPHQAAADACLRLP
jgi:glycosyltransferase involved in cell wall biosynthesis